MSIYDFTTSIFGEQFLPPYKRLSRYKSWVEVLLTPIQWLQRVMFDTYAKGEYLEVYDSGSTYLFNDVVQWVDYRLYKALQNVPISTPCSNTTYWILVSEDNVGLRQRAGATGQKLSLEFILNKHYNTVFTQPIIGISAIYIASLPVDTNYFVAGIDGTQSSYAAISGQNAEQFVGESYNYDTESLAIYVPNVTLDAISLGLESSPYPNAQKTVLTYANQFIFAGIITKVVGY